VVEGAVGKSAVDQSTVPLVFAPRRYAIAYPGECRCQQYPQRHIGLRYRIQAVGQVLLQASPEVEESHAGRESLMSRPWS
jgi:hypothetical protein